MYGLMYVPGMGALCLEQVSLWGDQAAWSLRLVVIHWDRHMRF